MPAPLPNSPAHSSIPTPYLQSTGFVLNPVGQVVVSVYPSGAIGRLVPDDVIGLVRYLRQHATV